MENLCFMRAFHIISHLRNCISNHSIDIDGLLFNSNDIFLAFIFVYCIDSLKIFLNYICLCIRQIYHFISSDAYICFQVSFILFIDRLNVSHISFS